MRYVVAVMASPLVSNWHMSFKQGSPNNFKKLVVLAFCHPILLRGVRSGSLMGNPIVN